MCSYTCAAALQQQFNNIHASIPGCLTSCSNRAHPRTFHHQLAVFQRSASVQAIPPRQQHLQRGAQMPRQQQRSSLFQQTRTLGEPQPQVVAEQTLQRSPQQQPRQGKDRVVWGYLDGDNADEWTWDDDYNPDAIARAAAEARQLQPTPRQVQQAAAAAAAARQRPTVITRLPEQFNRQVLSNAVLLVDKPTRWSSADVVRQLKSALKIDRVCFGAPLEMEATGLLIILLGAASRLTPKFEPLERTYTGTLKLGTSTTTYDASGDVVESNPWQHVRDEDIAAAAQGFVGEVQQVPSMWSSSKYKNKPLRWYAERGEVVAREAKSVHIASFETWRGQPPAAAGSSGGGSSSSSGAQGRAGSDTVYFKVVASKGASVRVLAHDLGKALGCGAHVTSVRREAMGGFNVSTAWSLDVLLPLARKYAKGFRQAQQY